jgi:PEP-CTERM motif
MAQDLLTNRIRTTGDFTGEHNVNRKLQWLAVAALALGSSHSASAAILDLTSGGDGTINGAYFITVDQQSTGTGVIDSFVRIQSNGNEEGYNADARPVMDDVNTSPVFTRDVNYSEFPVVTDPGNATGSYIEVLLDINQTNANPLLSLDSLQVYTRSTAIADADDLASLSGSSTLRYDLDAGTDNTVILDYSLNAGSGSGDLFVYIPVSLFAGVNGTDFVYLYSMFGATNASNDGFEEWALLSRPPTPPTVGVPEPGTLLLLSFGLIAAAFARRRTLPEGARA